MILLMELDASGMESSHRELGHARRLKGVRPQEWRQDANGGKTAKTRFKILTSKMFLIVLVCHLGDSVIHGLEKVLDGAGLTLKKIQVAAALCESLVEVIFNLPDLDRS